VQTCYRHPSRETGVSCSNCDRPICPDCMTPTSVGMRCPECAKQKTKVHTMQNVGSNPTVTTALIAINVLAFLGSGKFGFSDTGGNSVYAHGYLSDYWISEKHEYWRLATSGFLHANFVHILFNMYLLWLLGQMLEPVIGSVRFSAAYLASLLAGSFGAILLTPADKFTVGASGAIFGLMGVAVMEMRARGVDPMQSGIGGLILINLVITFAFSSSISVGGHVGGLIGGFLAGLAINYGDRQRSRALAVGGCLLIAALAVIGAIAAADPVSDSGLVALIR
jgi:membrane associated rhomboid family serine protease